MGHIELIHKTVLSAGEMKQKAEGLIREAQKEYQDALSDVRQEWKDNTLLFSFKAKGLVISGETILQDHLLIIKAKLPLAAMLFRRKIEDLFRKKADELFPA